MLRVPGILVSPPRAARRVALLALVALAACGQKGPLFIPSGEAAASRATLTETLAPSTSVAPIPRAAGSAPPTSGTASPVRNP